MERDALVTDADLLALHDNSDDPPQVNVRATDYSYDGWLMSVFTKRSGAMRCVVEDEYGRLFVHNANQIRRR